MNLDVPLGGVLGGHGPNGLTAVGRRGALGCEVLYLADADGDSLAWAVCDLAFASSALQRDVSARVRDLSPSGRCAALGSDRILLSTTHTHGSPSHHFAEQNFTIPLPVELDGFVARPSGYDPGMAELLADRIARGIVDACADADKNGAGAQIRWLDREVPLEDSFTANRSVLAHCDNTSPMRTSPTTCTPGVQDDPRANPRAEVSRTMTILQVLRGPAGAIGTAAVWVFFPIHPTAVPNGNDVYHADLFKATRDSLRAQLDTLTYPLEEHGAVALVNGAEGDVSPAWPASCISCYGSGFRLANAVGDALARQALIALAPSDSSAGAVGVEPLTLARVYADIPLTGGREVGSVLMNPVPGDQDLCSLRQKPPKVEVSGPTAALCARGVLGTAAAAGAEDGPTLYRYSEVQFQEGDSIASNACQSPKKEIARDALAPLLKRRFVLGVFAPSVKNLGAGPCAFAEVAPLSIVQLGARRVLTLPGEATTTAGMRLAASASVPGGPVAIIAGLTNGYLQYLATPEEFVSQQYEGGSTVYGPQTVPFLEHQVEQLARKLNGPDFVVQTSWTNEPVTLAQSRRLKDAHGDWRARHGTYVSAKNRSDDRIYALGGDRRPLHAGSADTGGPCMPLELVLRDEGKEFWFHPDDWHVRVLSEASIAQTDRHANVLSEDTLDIELRLVPSFVDQAPVQVSWFPDVCPQVGEVRCLEVERPTDCSLKSCGSKRTTLHCEVFSGPGWSVLANEATCMANH